MYAKRNFSVVSIPFKFTIRESVESKPLKNVNGNGKRERMLLVVRKSLML